MEQVIREVTVSQVQAACPRCGRVGKRHSLSIRHLREIGISAPTIVRLTYSKHFCASCQKYFALPLPHIAVPSSRYTNRVRRVAVDLITARRLSYEDAAALLRERYRVQVPCSTLHDWVALDLSRAV